MDCEIGLKEYVSLNLNRPLSINPWKIDRYPFSLFFWLAFSWCQQFWTMSHLFDAISCFGEPKESYYFLYLYDHAAFRTLGSISAFKLHCELHSSYQCTNGWYFYVLTLSPVSSGATILKSYSRQVVDGTSSEFSESYFFTMNNYGLQTENNELLWWTTLYLVGKATTFLIYLF